MNDFINSISCHHRVKWLCKNVNYLRDNRIKLLENRENWCNECRQSGAAGVNIAETAQTEDSFPHDRQNDWQCPIQQIKPTCLARAEQGEETGWVLGHRPDQSQVQYCTCRTHHIKCLTQLQLWVGLTQAPVHIAVAVSLLEQVVQHLSHVLPLVHHQSFGAAVVHQHLHHQLSRKSRFILTLRSMFNFAFLFLNTLGFGWD